MADDCWICLRVVASGLGQCPFTCANGHTLYRGSGATIDLTTGRLGVPPYCYEPTPATPREHTVSVSPRQVFSAEEGEYVAVWRAACACGRTSRWFSERARADRWADGHRESVSPTAFICACGDARSLHVKGTEECVAITPDGMECPCGGFQSAAFRQQMPPERPQDARTGPKEPPVCSGAPESELEAGS